MARYCPLFSGSSGNSTYVGTADGGVLIDAGVSAKRIKNALETREIDPSSLRAILVTHEHTDHISGLRVLLKQLKIPVIATEAHCCCRDSLESIKVKLAIGEEENSIKNCDTKEIP